MPIFKSRKEKKTNQVTPAPESTKADDSKKGASEEEDKAATKLQAAQRGKKAREEVADKKKKKEEEQAATKIQAVQRGKQAREEVKETKEKKKEAEKKEKEKKEKKGWFGSKKKDDKKSSQQAELLISATIRTDDTSGAESVQLALGSSEELQAMLAEAIQATQGIDEVKKGPIKVGAEVGEPVLLQRGRLTMIEDQLEAITSGKFVPNAFAPRSQRAGVVEAELGRLAAGHYGRGLSEPPLGRGRDMDFGGAQERGAYSAERSPMMSTPDDYNWTVREGFDDYDCTSRIIEDSERAAMLRLIDDSAPLSYEKQRANISRNHLQKFKQEMLRREQSLAGAWRTCLDPEWTGQLAIHDFCRACRRMGYRGNMKEIWNSLDVDGNGLISLMELDWDEAAALGKFRAKVLQQYPSCMELAKVWGMTGVRRYHVDDFTGLLLSWGFAETPAKADKLFRMLCGIPVGDGAAGFLGRLGPLKDSAPAVTSREFRWLDIIGEELPVVSFDRVMPGDLGMIAGMADGDAATEEEQIRMRIKTNEHQAILKHQEDIVFERLYYEAMEHVRRAKERAGPIKGEQKELSDPMLYERLYNDHILKKERLEYNCALADGERQQMFNQLCAKGSRKRDPLTIARLTNPKKKSNYFDFHCQAKKQDCYHLLDIDQLFEEAEIRAKEIRAAKDPNFEWKSFGKSRRELIWMLQQNVIEDKTEKPVPAACTKLYNLAAKREKSIQAKLEEHREKKRQEVIESYRCDLHKEHKSTCSLCKRWQAITTGQRDKKGHDAVDRLYAHATATIKSQINTRETAFRALIEEADTLGLLHDRTLISAKVLLEENFQYDSRWELAVGRDRDRLITEGIEHYTRLRREAELRGESYNSKTCGNTETFFRLFLDGTQRRQNWEEQRIMIDEAQMLELMDNSVHRDVSPNPAVFEQLYSNEKREGFDDSPQRSQQRLQERLQAQRRRREKNQSLARSRSPGKTPRTEGVLEELPPTSMEEDAPMAVFMMYFQTVKWRPPAAFESQLKNRMQEFGSGNLNDLNCRIRQATGDGIVVQFTGDDERIEALADLPLLSPEDKHSLHCGKHKLTRVWTEEGIIDPLGEFVDSIHMHYDNFRDAFNVIDPQKTGSCNRQEFMAGVQKLGFFGNAKFIWHALEGGHSGTLSAATFARLADAIVKVTPEPANGLGRKPTKELLGFFKQLEDIAPDASSAFEAVNLSRNGKLIATELVQAIKVLKLKNIDGKAIFREIDIRIAGVVLIAEWTRAYEVCRVANEDPRHKKTEADHGAGGHGPGHSKEDANQHTAKSKAKAKARPGDAEKRAQSAPAREKSAESMGKTQSVQSSPHKSAPASSPQKMGKTQSTGKQTPSNYEPDSEPSGANTPRPKQRAVTPKAKAISAEVNKIMPPKSGTPKGGAKSPMEEVKELHARKSLRKQPSKPLQDPDSDTDRPSKTDSEKPKGKGVDNRSVNSSNSAGSQKGKAKASPKSRAQSAPAKKKGR